MQPVSVRQESIWVPVGGDGDRLHLRHIRGEMLGPPLFLLHGSIENGKIFYSDSGKGLAPYLAAQGYDVYVGDLRGRGLSTPPMSRDSRFGQTESITEDIPAFLDEIQKRRGVPPEHWVAHSWGGVLLNSFWARFPERRAALNSLVCFGTKRRISVSNRQKFMNIDLLWNGVAPLLALAYGHLPVKKFRLGSDDESRKSLRHNRAWVRKGSRWIDPDDGFDYAAAIAQAPPPPTLHFAAIKDHFLGHPTDVQDFIRECSPRRVQYHLLSRDAGHAHDYGHIDMLTHVDAPHDHFRLVTSWLAGGYRLKSDFDWEG